LETADALPNAGLASLGVLVKVSLIACAIFILVTALLSSLVKAGLIARFYSGYGSAFGTQSKSSGTYPVAFHILLISCLPSS
jgi:hypothetical protein